MQHVLALEVLIALLLFAIVVAAGAFGIRVHNRRLAKHGSFKRLQSSPSGEAFVQLPLHVQPHASSSQTVSPYSASPFTSPSLHPGTVSFAKNLPKTPPSAASGEPRFVDSSQATISTPSTSSLARPSHTPREEFVLASVPTPLTASIPPEYTSGRTSSVPQEHRPAPLKPAYDTASLLDEELAPASRADGPSRPPRGGASPSKKNARHVSVPRSAWGTTTADGTSVSGQIYPSVSSYLARLQSTSRREFVQYTSALVAHGWGLLDELRGVTAVELRAAVRGMSSTDAEFLARSIKQELDWIDADRARGGMGFRMVLSS